MKRTCDTCRYFSPSALANATCRKNAPQVVSFAVQTGAGQALAVQGAWPTTKPDDWCGEWQEKRTTAGVGES